MRIALAQLNPTVGDLAGNRRLVEEAAAKAASERADLLLTSEMVLTGYPPMDLLERNGFVRDQLRELDALAAASHEVAIALGAVVPIEGERGAFQNACVLLRGGRREAVRAKTHLPTYDVFDERRWFTPAASRAPVPFGASSRSASPCARTPGSSRRATKWIRSASSPRRAPA
jgi:predicted amidohydrolase